MFVEIFSCDPSTTFVDKRAISHFDPFYIAGLLSYISFQFKGPITHEYTNLCSYNYCFTTIPNSFIYIVTATTTSSERYNPSHLHGYSLVRYTTKNNKKELIVDLICVRESLRIGTNLLNQLSQDAANIHHCTKISLHSVDNAKVLKFYTTNGFVKDKRESQNIKKLISRGEIPLTKDLLNQHTGRV